MQLNDCMHIHDLVVNELFTSETTILKEQVNPSGKMITSSTWDINQSGGSNIMK